MKWPIDHMGCWKSHRVTFAMFKHGAGVAHGPTLLASSLAPCLGDRESWDEWLLMELRHRYLALCGLAVHLHAVHASIGDLDASYARAHLHGSSTRETALAALRKRLLSSMCVCGLKASVMKGLCGVLLPLPVVL